MDVVDSIRISSLSTYWNLKQRQNKNDTIWSIIKLILKLPPFFTARVGEWKSAANSKLICLSIKWSRSYIVLLALVCIENIQFGLVEKGVNSSVAKIEHDAIDGFWTVKTICEYFFHCFTNLESQGNWLKVDSTEKILKWTLSFWKKIQKIALSAFYFIITLTYYYSKRYQRHLLAAIKNNRV